MTEEELRSAPVRRRGRMFHAFEVGQVFEHHWGRTLTEADNSLFSTLTLHFNPLYFNSDYARELGYEGTLLNPLLVFNTVVGMSVEDLSEAGGLFLGIANVEYGKPVYAGDTVYASSTVLAKRLASSGVAGPVTWRTVGRNQRGEIVVQFDRTNLIRMEG